MENIYIIEISDDKEKFYKIGVTVHRYCRFYEIMKVYKNVKIIYMVMGLDFYLAYHYESFLQGLFEPYTPLKKFGGYTECFLEIDLDLIKKILIRIDISKCEIVENLTISWR